MSWSDDKELSSGANAIGSNKCYIGFVPHKSPNYKALVYPVLRL